MLKNYVKIALRNLYRHKVHSLVKIASLGLGLATCALIITWVANELSYDRFHSKSDRIYRITHELEMGSSVRHTVGCSTPMGPAIAERLPEVASVVRLLQRGDTWVQHEDDSFKETGVLYADSSFFEVFSFILLEGDTNTVLRNPYSIVLTETLSQKYFPDEPCLGKLLVLDGDNTFRITGVVSDPPSNSSIDFNMLVSMTTAYAEDSEGMEFWGRLGTYTYLLLRPGVEASVLESKLGQAVDPDLQQRLISVGASLRFFLQSMTDIHLYSHLEGEWSDNGDIVYVYLFTAIAGLILLIAAFDFIVLTTSFSMRRALEVSVRKTFGASRGRLVTQFLVEALMCSIIASLVAIILMRLSLPLIIELSQGTLHLDYLFNPFSLLALVAFAAVVGLMAGIVPALQFASFGPARAQKNLISSGSGKSRFRQGTVLFQFAVTTGLIIATLTIYQQIDYLRTKRLGFDREQVLALSNLASVQSLQVASLRAEMADLPGVENASLTTAVPGWGGFTMTNLLPEGHSENESQLMTFLAADEEFVDAMGMQLVDGRSFSAEMASDSGRSVIINETAARQIGWDKPIGKVIKMRERTTEGTVWSERTVVGLVADFHYASLKEKIEPVVLSRDTGGLPTVSLQHLILRLQSGDFRPTLDLIKDKWELLSGGQPIDFFFLDDTVNEQYRNEELLGKLAMSFACLAIAVSCLGLFGMASHLAEQRTKEIGIRRVLGASIPSVLGLLSRESVMLVAVANIVAWPAAGYIMNRWLSSFAYGIDLPLRAFAASGLVTATIALSTIILRSLRTATANPVQVLHHE